MGYLSHTFELAAPDARNQHLQAAHRHLRAAIVHRNQITPEINDTGALDLETTMRLPWLYTTDHIQEFAERWGPLFGASPHTALTPEAFLQALYPNGTKLLFAGGAKREAEEAFSFDDNGDPILEQEENTDYAYPAIVSCPTSLHPDMGSFWPNPILPTHQKAVDISKLAKCAHLVARWRYLWVPVDDRHEPDWFLDQVLSGTIAPTAIFVRPHSFETEEIFFLMPCDHSTFKNAKKAVLKTLPEQVADDLKSWDYDLLPGLVPLPWRQDDYRLVYFNPPNVTE